MKRRTNDVRIGGFLPLYVAIFLALVAGPLVAKDRVDWVDEFSRGQFDGRPYEEALAVAADGSGSVYVAGNTQMRGQSVDFLLRKYSSSGAVWSREYEAPGDPSAKIGNDYARAVAVDPEGNPVVVGEVSVPAEGNPRGRQAYGIVKYDAMGEFLWESVHFGANGTSSHSEAVAVVTDARGRTFVTGTVRGAQEEETTIETLCYDELGNLEWVDSFETGRKLEAVGLVHDAPDLLYVAGTAYSERGDGDYLLVKLSTDGDEEWARFFDGGYEGHDDPHALCIDRDHNIVMTGASAAPPAAGFPPQGEFSDIDYLTAKFRPDGTVVWSARFDGKRYHKRTELRSSKDVATAVGTDERNGVYVTGYADVDPPELVSRPRAPGSIVRRNWATIKYDSNGGEEWLRVEAESVYDEAYAIAVHRRGDCYVAGHLYQSLSIVKYSTAGEKLWRADFRAPRGGDVLISFNVAEAMVQAPDESVYAVGRSEVNNTSGEGDWDSVVVHISAPRFIRGDANGDGIVGGSITDAAYLLNWTFLGGPSPPCRAAADADGDGIAGGSVTDPVYLLNHLFLGGRAPPAPYPGCGPDSVPAGVDLGCEVEPEACE